MAENERTEQVYGTIVTDLGVQLLTAATIGNDKVNISHIAVGDGAGSFYMPLSSAAALKNEVWRGAIASSEIIDNTIKITAIIPPDAGGFVIREYGIFDVNNRLIAISNCADVPKGTVETGAVTELKVSMYIIISNADQLNKINIIVDPNIISATKKDVENLKNKIEDKISGLQQQIESIRTFSGDYNDLKNKPNLFSGDYNDLTNKPLSMPANGGNASTVNGYTVKADVPANAKFTDTTYPLASQYNDGLMSVSCYNYIATLSSTPIGYVTGTYSGTGGQQVFNLGFTPSAVIINTTNDHNLNAYRCVLAIRGSAGWIGHCYIVDNGFSVLDSCSNGYHVYNYIAFK